MGRGAVQYIVDVQRIGMATNFLFRYIREVSLKASRRPIGKFKRLNKGKFSLFLNYFRLIFGRLTNYHCLDPVPEGGRQGTIQFLKPSVLSLCIVLFDGISRR